MPRATTVVLAIAATAAFAPMLAITSRTCPTATRRWMYHAPLAATLWKAGNLTSFLDASPQNVSARASARRRGLVRHPAMDRRRAPRDLGQLPFAALGAVSVYVLARRCGLLRACRATRRRVVPAIADDDHASGMQHDDLSGGAIAIASAGARRGAPPCEHVAARSRSAPVSARRDDEVALLPRSGAVGLDRVSSCSCVARRRPRSQRKNDGAVDANARTREASRDRSCSRFSSSSRRGGRGNLVRYHPPG
jgi:hypothetical protein